jgi:hypothetical protein
MRHNIPYFTVAIMASAQQEVASLRKKFDSLYTPIMTLPCVHPLLGDKTIMFLVAQVGGRVDETFARV